MSSLKHGLVLAGCLALVATVVPDRVHGYSGGNEGAADSPNAATRAADLASSRAERGIRACGARFEGQSAALNQCVAGQLDRLAQDLSKPAVTRVAPKAAPVVRTAARNLRPKKRKSAGAAVMNRARSVLRKLAAASQSETRRVYDRVARVFAVAASVISQKGGV